MFGEVEPNSNEKIKNYLDNSYETGTNIFRKLGLTAQVANETTIATNKSYKKIKIDNINSKSYDKLQN